MQVTQYYHVGDFKDQIHGFVGDAANRESQRGHVPPSGTVVAAEGLALPCGGWDNTQKVNLQLAAS